MKKFIKILLPLLLWSNFYNALAKENNETIEYYAAPLMSPGNGRYNPVDSSISIRVKGSEIMVFAGRSSVGGKNCGDREWRCVRVPFMFNFSVNNKWKSLPKEWEYDSHRYQNLGLEKISIFGKKIEAYLICSYGGGDDSKSPTRDACFNYSLKYGVLAIYLYDDGFNGETVIAYYASAMSGLFALKGL
jgi:hypothetical protein